MKKSDIAQKYFCMGYNCSQSVVLAFKEEIGIDEESLIKLSIGLGGGVGRMREVCGAVSGATVVLGFINGSTDPNSKNDVYPIIQKFAERFKENFGSIVCRELLEGVSVAGGSHADVRTEEFYRKRPCLEIVKTASDIVEELLCDGSLSKHKLC